MMQPAEALEPTPSSETDDRVPAPEDRAEQLAEHVKAKAQAQAQAYLRETIVPEGGE